MDDELVLLTSYFNLAGGRRQDHADTFRVQPGVTSATSPDGPAALYVVTEASATGQMGPRSRSLAAEVVVSEYQSRSDDPPATRLKAALRAAHAAVAAEFDGHVAVGVTVMAVENDTVYLGQVGPAQVYVLHAGNLHSISPDPGELSPFQRSIGSRSGPEIAVFRDQIGPEDVVALCSSWFGRNVEADDLRECFSAETSDDIAEGLLTLVKDRSVRDATGIVVEAIPASVLEAQRAAEQSPGFMEQVDTAVQALASVGRMLLSELRPPPPEPGATPLSSTTVADVEPSAEPRVPEDDLQPDRLRRRFTFRSLRRVPQPELDTDEEVPLPPSSPSDDVTPPTTAEESPRPGPRWKDLLRSRTDVEQEAPSVVPHEPPGLGGYPASQERRDPASAGPGVPGGPAGDAPPLPERPPQAERTAPATETRGDYPAPDTTVRDQRTEEVPIIPVEEPGRNGRGLSDAGTVASPPATDRESPFRRKRLRRRPRPTRPEPENEAEAEPAGETPERSDQQAELDQVNSRLQNDPDMGTVIPPVQGFPDAGTEPERIYATSKQIQAVNKRPRRFGGMTGTNDPLAGPAVIRPGLSELDLSRPHARSTPPAIIWFGIAAVFALAAGSLLLFLHHRQTPRTIPPYPTYVRQNLALAQRQTVPSKQDYYLSQARKNLVLAGDNGYSPARLQRLRVQLQTTTDALHHVTRESTPRLLGDFSRFPGAQPTEIMASSTGVMVLDVSRKAVFSLADRAASTPVLIVQKGDQVDGFTIGIPQHIAVDGSTALIVDDRNVLVRDSAETKTATSLTEQLQNERLVSLATSDPDVYQLDAAHNQLWRYPRAVSSYNPVPWAFFTSNAPNLGHAVSFAFDHSNVYILQSDGSVAKFDILGANPQTWATDPVQMRVPLRNPVALFTAGNLNFVWIADPANKRVLQFDPSGKFSRSYKSGSAAMHFSEIKSLSVSPSGTTLFVLCGSKVFEFPVAR